MRTARCGKDQKRGSVKPLSSGPSKRVKITPPENNIKKMVNHVSTTMVENIIPLPPNVMTRQQSRSCHKSMEVEKKQLCKYSFDKPYSNDVHQSQFRTEKRFFSKVGEGIAWEGNPINPAMRSILVNWLAEVVDEFKMKSQTLFLSVMYLDRFLQATNDIHRHLLQLVGVTCLWIAAKFEEVDVPDVEEFVYITDNTYNTQEIISTERYILNRLDYDLACVTIENFLYRFLEVGGITPEQDQMTTHAKFVAELSLTYYPINKLYSPSLIAASIVCLVKHTNNMLPICSQLFLSYTCCTKEQIIPCMHYLLYAYKNITMQQTALVEKYKKEKYKSVALIVLNENIEL